MPNFCFILSIGVKNSNYHQKFMHVEIDVKSMQTNFDGYGLSALGDIATLQNGQIYAWTMSMVIKN